MLCRRPNRVNAKREKCSVFSLADRADSKAAAPEIESCLGKSSARQSRYRRSRRNRHKCALDMTYSVQPQVLNFKREEHSVGSKHTPNFRKCVILKFARAQMMKHENRYRRRKSLIREG
jgi:hypothetical protein